MSLLYEHTKRVQAHNEELEQKNAEYTSQVVRLTDLVRRLANTPHTPKPIGSPVILEDIDKQQLSVNVESFVNERLNHLDHIQIYSILMEAQSLVMPETLNQSALEAAMLMYSEPSDACLRSL